MALKCSVLGHAYGETTVERDREERGSEVVITIRELETCDRCGDTRVVTENKEVTSIETPDDEPEVTPEDAVEALDRRDANATADDEDEALVDDAEGGAAVTEGAADSPAPEAVEDQGAEILDDADDGEAAVDDELADPTIENAADVPGDTTEETEDAVILEDDGDDAAATESDVESEPPTAEAEDAETEDAEAASTGAFDEDERGPFEAPPDETDDDVLGEWPEETLRDTDDDDWTPSEDMTGTVGDVDPDADLDRDISTNSAVTVPDGEFHCQGCGYTTPVESSSLRAGDYCPECRKETLVHRPEE